jgi:hypothetical protein
MENRVEVGDVVSVRHFSGVNPFKGIIVETSLDDVKIKLSREMATKSFTESDPTVIGVEKGSEVFLFGADVKNVDVKTDEILLVLDKVENFSDIRRHERFPVSLYADVRTKFIKKKHLAVIKDLSYFGMHIYSKEDFPIGIQIEIDIYMEKNMVFLKGDIVRKVKDTYYNKYGMRIVYEDINSMNFMKEYIRRIKEQQEDLIRKMKEL